MGFSQNQNVVEEFVSGGADDPIVLSLPMAEVTLPSPLQQWVTTAATTWPLAKLVLAIDPAFRRTWQEVREVLSTRESFTEQAKNIKSE